VLAWILESLQRQMRPHRFLQACPYDRKFTVRELVKTRDATKLVSLSMLGSNLPVSSAGNIPLRTPREMPIKPLIPSLPAAYFRAKRKMPPAMGCKRKSNIRE
jgi:hypothetical protein